MIPRLAALALALTLAARPAAACPDAGGGLLFHSCWGEARAELVLLPEDLPLPVPPAEGLRLVVTGAYTGTDLRGEGLPKPVGLFLRRGAVVNRNLGRMDGVLLVDPEGGRPAFQHREAVRLDGRDYDLRDLDQRAGFIRAAAEQGLSVMQSHLLIDRGELDVRPQDGAPVYVRRFLFADAHGFGVWQTQGAMTLHDAAMAVAEALAPQMVMNLDMGSYDYCRRAEGGIESGCGGLASEGVGKLSNLLVLTVR
ncbi:MAG TPA: hypothetical protein VMM59_06700 [Thermohalobaculum sp.]|nr:hypothetical protein [Thermohalobaculum sp.]